MPIFHLQREVVEMTVESVIEHGEKIPQEPEKGVIVSHEPVIAVPHLDEDANERYVILEED